MFRINTVPFVKSRTNITHQYDKIFCFGGLLYQFSKGSLFEERKTDVSHYIKTNLEI